MLKPATAYWGQRNTLEKLAPRLKSMGETVGHLTDMTHYQWAQLASMALEFKPDLIIELGRGKGNSTCIFTEAANILGNTKVVSLCLTSDFVVETLPRLMERGYISVEWLKPLECWVTDITRFDFDTLLAKHKRVMLFWDAHGFEVASCVLGKILPVLQHKEHIVMMHDMSDQRYIGTDSLDYKNQILWRGSDADGARIVLGFINSAVPQAVSIIDFACRNQIDLLTADHSMHTEIKPYPALANEMQQLLGDDFFAFQAHWLCFSLNDYPGPFTFPRFVPPEKPLVQNSVELLAQLGSIKASGPEPIGAEASGGHNRDDERKQKLLDSVNQGRFDQFGSSLLESSVEELRELFGHDPWLCNYLVNKFEYATGSTVLTSYPWDVTLPISEACNASCLFCNTWLHESLCIHPDTILNYAPLLKNAVILGLAGYGEPLAHPELHAVLDNLRSVTDPRCQLYVNTNGSLIDRYLEKLMAVGVKTFNISLNAASPETHHKLMKLGVGAFDRITNTIRTIRHRYPDVSIYLTFVVTSLNIHEVSSFIALGNELHVDHITMRTLQPWHEGRIEENYRLLPPYLHPEFKQLQTDAINAIRNSSVPVTATPEVWDVPIFTNSEADVLSCCSQALETPDVLDRKIRLAQQNCAGKGRGERLADYLEQPISAVENIYGRKPRYCCKRVYTTFNIGSLNYFVSLCCYLNEMPGYAGMHYDGTGDFFEIWNSPAWVELRRRLNQGPLLKECLTCLPAD